MMLSLACGGEPRSQVLPPLPEEGTLEVTTASGVEVPESFHLWSSHFDILEYPDGALRFALYGGASATGPEGTHTTIGFTVYGDVLDTLQLVGTYPLPDWTTQGERNQVGYTTDRTTQPVGYTSYAGTLEIADWAAGEISGHWSAQLTDLATQTEQVTLSATFSGATGGDCTFYAPTDSGQDAWVDADLSDPRCAALFP